MAQNEVNNINKVFPIYKADGTSFYNLVIHKATVESVIMSLGDKISGDVYYPNNNLPFTMQEYVELDGVRYYLVSPPTIVREGLVKDNSGLNGMTKYSLVFYHPMYMLSNFPFTDIAVTEDEENYLAQNKTFSWIGNLFDFVEKINTNLEYTEWKVVANIPIDDEDNGQYQKALKLSEVLSFDKNFISDALKTAFDTWEIPFTITSIDIDETIEGQVVHKSFLIEFGLPSQEILDGEGQPYIFKFGQGVGLKNNSRTPKNNKIVTRIVGSGSERNIPYGYPQIEWKGNPDWDYTIDNNPDNPNSYPIYKGILNGQYVKLIKHPFTRKTLMPTVYRNSVFNKVSKYSSWDSQTQQATLNQKYNPNGQIIDYIDAEVGYPNPINLSAPSVEIHQFEDIYPRFGNNSIVSATPIDTNTSSGKVAVTPTIADYIGNQASPLDGTLYKAKNDATNQNEKDAIQGLIDFLNNVNTYPQALQTYYESNTGGSYTYSCTVQPKGTGYEGIYVIEYTSDNFTANNIEVKKGSATIVDWDDTMNDNGEYVQSYFKLTLPILGFDLYACASITENMQINMRGGACIGCTFNVMVDWEDYKRNFYDAEGRFDPIPHTQQDDGHVRDVTKYPDSTNNQIEIICQKDLDTFGTIMPNKYQKPQAGDTFVILGISLPESYITTAEAELQTTMGEYMLENNVHYFEYPLKFDEHFLVTHQDILAQIKNNNIVRFQYIGTNMALYIKQITIKYGESVLPQWDITLTDDVEIVLSKIGQVTDDVSRMRVELSELQKYYNDDILGLINEKLSNVYDDVAQGKITFQQGLDALGSVLLSDEIKSNGFISGLGGRGWRIDHLGNAEVESLKVRSYLEVIELLINRIQAQEGDTLFTDNDQIDKVERIENGGEVSYILSLKEKYDGYVTSQMYGNILKGVINTLAAKEARVSDYEGQTIEVDGSNSYYTSWMRVVETHSTNGSSLSVNQIRVVLYGDAQTPARKNFVPCELMAIARWGCVLDPNEDGISSAEKASRERRQRLFYLSNTDGRIVKLRGVNKPILENDNYGTTLGILPDFITDPESSVASRLIEGRDYLYAQGVVVGDFIKVDINYRPLATYVDCGEWVDGGAQGVTPTVGNGIYLHDEMNDVNLQWETHDVWHNGLKWRCLQHQPVTIGLITTYYEPKWGSDYWMPIEGDRNLTMEFYSSNGYTFRRNTEWQTVVTPHVFFGGIDITSEATNTQGAKVQFLKWERTHEVPMGDSETLDAAWNAQHVNGATYGGVTFDARTLNLSYQDMTMYWATNNKLIFTCYVQVNDGSDTIIIDNQIIT